MEAALTGATGPEAAGQVVMVEAAWAVTAAAAWAAVAVAAEVTAVPEVAGWVVTVASAWVVAAVAADAATVAEAAAWTGATAVTAAPSCPEERAVVQTTRAGVAAGVCAARTGGVAWRRERGGVRRPRVAALTRGSGVVALAR